MLAVMRHSALMENKLCMDIPSAEYLRQLSNDKYPRYYHRLFQIITLSIRSSVVMCDGNFIFFLFKLVKQQNSGVKRADIFKRHHA